MSYIGKVQVESGEPILIGSTLYGVCPSSVAASNTAKTVTLSNFDTLINGVTVHVRFVNGNTVTSGLTLAVGSTGAKTIVGNCVCNENDIVAFTFHQETVNNIETEAWYVNSNIVAAEGSTNGQIKINGQNISVHGLNSAAYSSTNDFATAAQGTLADNAMPKSGGTFTGPISGPTVDDTSATGTLATVDYVRSKTAGLSGLTGAMHFKGTSTTSITDGGSENPTIGDTVVTIKESGDVVLYQDKEFVWNGTSWELLGDEGSYVLKTSQTSSNVGSASGWSAGSASSATVSNGVLVLTNSTTPSLTVTSTNVVVPVTPSTP